MAAVKIIGEGYYGISAGSVTADRETYERMAKVFAELRPEPPPADPPARPAPRVANKTR